MGSTLQPWPKWAERALQGLAFWMGHRHALYRDYPLSEGALVAETCNLICAQLPTAETLFCEVQYSRLVPSGRLPADLRPKARADLVVAENMSGINRDSENLSAHVLAAIEVKRASAPRAQIVDDLKRLAAFKLVNPAPRALLFVVAEARRPSLFVSDEGTAILGKHEIPGANAHYRVRRACKAAAAFSGKESAHYACIIEVFPGAIA
jgi:hypothetical protein